MLEVKNKQGEVTLKIDENGNVQINGGKFETGKVSDGYHTFDELYYHRMMLFAVICNSYREVAWKSKLHHDGTMYKDYFIVGVDTPMGQYSYHYHIDNYDMFDVKELDKAPEWDGHKPEDINRLMSLLAYNNFKY